jgi:hypothetical protein
MEEEHRDRLLHFDKPVSGTNVQPSDTKPLGDLENRDHYVRDVSMHEDWSRIRVNPDRMVVMRSFGLNMMRANGVKNVKDALFGNGLSLEKLLTYEHLMEN